MKSSGNLWLSDEFRGSRSQLIRLTLEAKFAGNS